MTKWIPTLSLAIHEKKALYITSTGVLETGLLRELYCTALSVLVFTPF